jgi:hypothetical protein
MNFLLAEKRVIRGNKKCLKKNIMKNGIARFEYYLDKVEALLQQAVKEKNPALWLYLNDLRTPMFMLEALARLYANLHNKNKFTKLKEHFKLLEDGLGAVDYYDNYAKIFLANPTVPVHIREYMQAQAREKIQHVDDVLHTNNWIGDNPVRIQKIKKKLAEVDWLQPKDEVKAVRGFYKSEIEEIKKELKDIDGKFTEMEAQMHEFRRNIRWLSIYPQALRGMIQLTKSELKEEGIEKYLVDEIVHSKYNVMPDAGDNEWFLLLEKNYFYALSWLIAETGKLKDEGLQFFAITEALQQTEGMDHDTSLHKTFEILGVTNDAINNILSRASDITAQFMKEQNLDKLVYGAAHIRDIKSNKVAASSMS